MASEGFPSTRVRSHPERASYDPGTLHDVLDSSFLAHLSVAKGDYPKVVPMMFVRRGEHVYIHARRGTELAVELAQRTPLCLAVTVLDGFVLAHRVRYHSLNYRSAVIYGMATALGDPEEKRAMFGYLMDKVWPGRVKDADAASDEELAYVEVFGVPLDRASVKVRQGGPMGPPGAEGGPWTGHVDLQHMAGTYHPAENIPVGLAPPAWPHSHETHEGKEHP